MKAKAKEWDSVWSSQNLMIRMLNYMRDVFTVSLYKKVFKKYVSKNTTLLEVGCGSSTTTLYIAPKIKKVYGLDISDEALKISRQKAKRLGVSNAEFVKGDCFKMPFKSGTFDIVWSQGLLEHFDHPEGIMSEKIRVAKKGGRVITIVPGLWSYHKPWYVITRPKLLRRFWPWTEQTFYTKKKLNALLDNRVVLERIFHYPVYGVIVQIARKR